MENKYRLIFFKYIYYLLNLNKYEIILLNNGIEYIDNVNLMCREEKECFGISHYFYMLNDINITNLNSDELTLLKNIDVNFLNEDIIKFLKKTYKKVLFSPSPDGNIYYGPFMENEYKADVDAIAIGLKYNVYGLATGHKKDMQTIEKEKTIVTTVINQIEKNNQYKIKVIVYDELHEKLVNQNLLITKDISSKNIF